MKRIFLLCVYCLSFRSYESLGPNIPVKCAPTDVTAFETIFKPVCGEKNDGLIKSIFDCLSVAGIFSTDSLGECAIKSVQDLFKQFCDGDVKFKDNYCCLLDEDVKLNPDVSDPAKKASIFKECIASPEDSCKQQIKDLKEALAPKCDVFPKDGDYPVQLWQCFKNNRLMKTEQTSHSGYYQPYDFFNGICKGNGFAEDIYCDSIKRDFESSAHKTAEVKVIVKKCMAEKKLPPVEQCTQVLHDLRQALNPKCANMKRDGQYVVDLKKCFTEKGITAHQQSCEKDYKFPPFLFFGSICVSLLEAHELYCCSVKKDLKESKKTPADAKKIVSDCVKKTVDPCEKQLKDVEDAIAPACDQLSKDGKYPNNLFKCFTDNGLMNHQKPCQRRPTKPFQFFDCVCKRIPYITDQLCCSAPKDFPSMSNAEVTAKIKEIVNKCMGSVKP